MVWVMRCVKLREPFDCRIASACVDHVLQFSHEPTMSVVHVVGLSRLRVLAVECRTWVCCALTQMSQMSGGRAGRQVEGNSCGRVV